jgi:hypothetical protein
MARRYGAGEEKPEGTCIADGCGRRGKQRTFGTCGRQACIENVNSKLRGAAIDRRDPARGGKVKIAGKWKDVKYSKTIRGVHCAVLKDGTAVPLDRTEDQSWI